MLQSLRRRLTVHCWLRPKETAPHRGVGGIATAPFLRLDGVVFDADVPVAAVAAVFAESLASLEL